MRKFYSVVRAKIAMVCVAVLISVSGYSQTDVLVCGAASPQSWLDDVQAKLVSTGSFSSVSTYNLYLTGTPTLSYLQTFDAVLVYTDYGCQDPTTFGNNLAAYIDGGGAVVNAVFSTASVLVQGNFNSSTYQVCIPNSGQNATPQLTLGPTLDPCSPIMNGITSFDGGSSSYRTTSSSFVPGSVTVSTWSNGEWLVARRTNVGPMNVRRCDLNFYPPSSDVRSDFWQSSTQGAQLMANAILWTAGVTSNSATPASPTSITGTNVVCVGTATSFSIPSVVGATGYTWSVPIGATITSGQGTTTINVSTTSATTGNVTVTADNACGSSAPTVISFTVNALPTIGYSVAPSLTVCAGTSVTLSGSGAAMYSWTGGINNGVPFNAVMSTTYTVTGTDANGCSNVATAPVVVNQLPAVVANTTTSTVCSGSSVTLSGSGAAMYSWTGGVMNAVSFVPTNTDTYTVTGTDGNGCSNTATVSVTVNALPSVAANTTANTVCEGGSVTLTGSGAAMYMWTGGVTDGVAFVPTISDTYTVTGTDVNGCSSTDAVSITVNPLPIVSGSASATSVCTTDGGVTLTGTPTGGMWSGPGVSGNTFTAATAGQGSHVLTYNYTDSSGCSAADSVTIDVNLCLGLADNSSNNYSVYPNPNNGTFTLAVNTNAGDVNIELVDLSGRVVYSSTESNVQTGFTTQIVTEHLAAGTYMLRVISQNEQQNIRINVQ